jgi:hypothetical protein
MFGHQMAQNIGNGNGLVNMDIKNVIPESEKIKVNEVKKKIEFLQSRGLLMSDPNLVQSLSHGTIPPQDMLSKIFQKMMDIEETYQKILQSQTAPNGSNGTMGQMGQNSISGPTTECPDILQSVSTLVKINSDSGMTIERDQMSKGRLSTPKESLMPITRVSHSNSSSKGDESRSDSRMNQIKPPTPRKSLYLKQEKSGSSSIGTRSNVFVKQPWSSKTIDALRQHTPNSRPSKATSRLVIDGSGTPKIE